MLVPLYGFLAGDTIGLLVLVHAGDTVRDFADRLLEAASVRVRRPIAIEVRHEGKPIDPLLTIARAGLAALDRVDVVALES